GQRSPPGALLESGAGAKLRGLETAGGLVLARSHPRRALVIDVLDDAVQRGPEGSPDGGKVVALPGLEETHERLPSRDRARRIAVFGIGDEGLEVGAQRFLLDHPSREGPGLV